MGTVLTAVDRGGRWFGVEGRGDGERQQCQQWYHGGSSELLCSRHGSQVTSL